MRLGRLPPRRASGGKAAARALQALALYLVVLQQAREARVLRQVPGCRARLAAACGWRVCPVLALRLTPGR